jgi:ATP-dependent helicase/nuclease subunit B
MIEFILGGAGSGKSAMIRERILSELYQGKKVMLIVPEQAALSTESKITLEAQRQSVSTLNLEVLNFSRLCNRAFRQYGGISYSSVTPGAKALILWDALFSSIPYLKHYKTEIEDADKFVSSLSSLITEFKAYNVTPAMLSEASDEALEDNEKLSNKLSDLSLIYSSYLSLLNEKWDDPSDDLSKLAGILESNEMFKGTSVYIHSFKGFTPQQLKVLRYVFAQAENVTVTLCMRDDENTLTFESVKETKKALTELLRTEPKITRVDGKCDRSDELAYIENNLWNSDDIGIYDKATDRVRTVVCSDPYDEAEFVASDILSYVRNGDRYRDFAVIARDIERYSGIIDAVFEKFGLPCRVFNEIPLSEQPLFKLIISALDIKNGGWSTNDVMVYLKTGLCPITPSERDTLENYVSTWNIRGSQWHSDNGWFMNPDGYTDRLTAEGAELLDKVNELRVRTVRPLEKLHEYLDGRSNVKAICRAIYDFLSELEVDKKILEADSDDEIRLWNCLCDVLDTMCETVGERKADSKLFTGLFTTIVSQSGIGTLPATIDEIAVGSANLMRTDGVKRAYILGLNENVFPAQISENSFFSDADKIYLETCGVNLSPTSDKCFYEELFYFYTALTCASESVTLICASKEVDGKALRPSVAFNRIPAIMPFAQHTKTSELDPSRLICTPSQSLEHIFSLQGEEGEALRRVYDSMPEYCGILNADKQPLQAANEQLDKSIASKLFNGDLYLTQSRLDKFVLCSFSYQCAYVLKLKEQAKAEFSPADTGNLIHRVLEKFFSGILTDGKIPEITDSELEKQIDEILSDYLSGIFGKETDVNISKRSFQLFMRLKRTLKILIRNLLNEFKESEFIPSFFEMRIDESGAPGTVAPLKFPLPDGSTATIYGIADRVDTCKRGNDVYVRVVDYKTGKKEFNLSDIALGLNLQMLIYLFSLWNDGNGSVKNALDVDGEVIPTGVLYLKAKLDDIKADADTDPAVIYELAEKSLKRSGLVINDEEILRMMEKKLSGKYIPVSLKNDGQFTSASINSLHTLEEFGALRRSIEDTVIRLATEIKGGKAECKPLKNKRNDGCKYCPYSAVCRNASAFESKEDKGKLYG